MEKNKFNKLLENKILILDGATGTELVKRGMTQGVCPEKWIIDNPQAIIDTQNAYFAAGSDIVLAPTFGANAVKLSEAGIEGKTSETNRKLAELSRRAAAESGRGKMVFGDIGPTGKFVEPFGELAFEQAVGIFKEQVKGLLSGGVEGFAIETMMDIQEVRAVVLAIRESCDLPILCSMTFDATAKSLTGNTPLSALITLQALGVSAFGCNCSTGPAEMLKIITELKPYATVPLLAKPNAGLPKLVNNEARFDMDAATFASFVPQFAEAGANILGGCCGTTPEHIKAQALAAAGLQPLPPCRRSLSAVSSARGVCLLGQDKPLRIIGERINPTGKKALQAELREGKLNIVKKFAVEQELKGANILDVNMGLSGIDEKAMMEKTLRSLCVSCELPLCIDSSDPAVIERALRLYPGRALVNSISAERERLEKTLPLAAKYGAMFILLPLDDDSIPDNAAGRIALLEKILAEAKKYGYRPDDICVDGLVMTVSSSQQAARVTLEFIRHCGEKLGMNTVCGLSNVSFGMPERKWINAAFFSMALGNGLNMAIANPDSEMIRNLALASDVISLRDAKARNYVGNFSESQVQDKAKTAELSAEKKLYQCVVQGNEENLEAIIKQALDEGFQASELVDKSLVPAIAEVGDLYDCGKYFLPQLIMSADTMRNAFTLLEPMLKASGVESRKKAVFVIATVEGDIHDIGKNIVALMLRNYGFEVIDLGKDVKAPEIIAKAKECKADMIGLSALMTTTMLRMREVVELAKAEKLEVPILIGGAVVDQDYADEIGAYAYCADAMDAVRKAEEIQKSKA